MEVNNDYAKLVKADLTKAEVLNLAGRVANATRVFKIKFLNALKSRNPKGLKAVKDQQTAADSNDWTLELKIIEILSPQKIRWLTDDDYASVGDTFLTLLCNAILRNVKQIKRGKAVASDIFVRVCKEVGNNRLIYSRKDYGEAIRNFLRDTYANVSWEFTTVTRAEKLKDKKGKAENADDKSGGGRRNPNQIPITKRISDSDDSLSMISDDELAASKGKTRKDYLNRIDAHIAIAVAKRAHLT